MREFTLKCISTDGLIRDPHDGEVVQRVTIESRECTTVGDMVDLFNVMLVSMGFIAKVDQVEDEE
jgi:hypothetical protein